MVDYKLVNTVAESISLVICMILLMYQITEKKKTKSDQWFNVMIVSNAIMLICDICDWTLGGTPGRTVYMLEVVLICSIYYIASGFLLFSLFNWLIVYVSPKTTLSLWWQRIAGMVTLVHIILALVNPFVKFTYINADNQYVRGDLFWLLLIFPYIVYTMALIILVCYRKYFARNELIYLAIFTTIPLIAEIVQLITYTYATINVAVSLGLIVVLMFIESQRAKEHERQKQESIINENRELIELRENQNDLIEQLIDVLCGTVEAKDQYTRGHSFRVAGYAREIMYRLGADEKTLQEVYYIGILHDVGKISIPDNIIHKKERLTDDEYEQIKLHTVAGYQILRGVTAIPDLAVGARWHHEKYDGTGYPNGLAGENIPLIARVISVADAYDAMTSNRSYHATVQQSYAREQIEKGMGTQFDPKIAQIMLDMIDEDTRYDMKQVKSDNLVNILMIDDDPFIHKLVETVLKDEGYILTFASSGEEGIQYLRDFRYDLCLLDMEMPGMNGFEVLDWIHNNIRRMKVIFLTGDKSIDVIRKSEKLGAVDYVTKPVNATFLKESINSVLLH